MIHTHPSIHPSTHPRIREAADVSSSAAAGERGKEQGSIWRDAAAEGATKAAPLMCSPVRGVSLVTRFLFLYNALMIFAERERCAEKKVKGRGARGCTLGGGDKPAADRRPQKLGRRRRTPRHARSRLPAHCSLSLSRAASASACCVLERAQLQISLDRRRI
jgi:hypothetical protein